MVAPTQNRPNCTLGPEPPRGSTGLHLHTYTPTPTPTPRALGVALWGFPSFFSWQRTPRACTPERKKSTLGPELWPLAAPLALLWAALHQSKGYGQVTGLKKDWQHSILFIIPFSARAKSSKSFRVWPLWPLWLLWPCRTACRSKDIRS